MLSGLVLRRWLLSRYGPVPGFSNEQKLQHPLGLSPMRGAPAVRLPSAAAQAARLLGRRRRAPRHLVAPLALPQHARAGPGVRYRLLRRVHRPGAAIGLTYPIGPSI